MDFETVERQGRIHVVKNGVESRLSAERDVGIGSGRTMWNIRRPYVTRVTDTLKNALEMIAADMNTWYTATEAAARLVEMGVFDEPPSPQRVTKWCRDGLLPSAFKLLGRGARGSGGAWRIPEAALRAFAERRKEQWQPG